MDNPDWEGAQVVMNMQESIMMTNPNFCGFNGEEEISYPIQDLQRSHASDLVFSSAERGNVSVQQQVPGISFPADTMVAKPGSYTSFREALSIDQICNSSALVIDRPYNKNPLGRFENGNYISLDCLLSATNSNKDASVDQEDGISMIFADCRNIWKFASGSAVSSGESETSASSNSRKKNVAASASASASQSSSHQTKKILNPAKRKINDYISSQVFQSCLSTTTQGGFQLISESHQPKAKKLKSEKLPSISNISFQQPNLSMASPNIDQEPDPEAIAQMKEMIYRAAAFRPVNFGLEVVEKPKRKNVRISTDPQTMAARQRRERVSEKIRILQKLVPGGSKMDTASMLDEAANYLKFLRSQVKALESLGNCPHTSTSGNLVFSSLPFNHSFPMQNHFHVHNPNHVHQI